MRPTLTSPGDGPAPRDLYRFFDAEGVLLYVGISLNAAARASQHAKGKPWWPDVARMDVEHFDNLSRREMEAIERAAIAVERPAHNVVWNNRRPTRVRFGQVRRASGPHACRLDSLPVGAHAQLETVDGPRNITVGEQPHRYRVWVWFQDDHFRQDFPGSTCVTLVAMFPGAIDEAVQIGSTVPGRAPSVWDQLNYEIEQALIVCASRDDSFPLEDGDLRPIEARWLLARTKEAREGAADAIALSVTNQEEAVRCGWEEE